jgi:mannose-6-phosphate isomerase-like protein (cupin superfamily)
MNVKEYIESGVLEEYCLGWLSNEEQAFVIQMTLLYPEVKEELTRIELFMEALAKANAVDVINPDLREKILNSLGHISQNYLDLDNLPVINQDSDHQIWLNSLKHLIPAEPAGDMIFKPLRQNNNKVTQTLVISKINVPKETHTDVLECFLILQGECECTIGEHVFKAGPGGFIDIPLYVEHDVKILSPVVVAVLQHQLV